MQYAYAADNSMKRPVCSELCLVLSEAFTGVVGIGLRECEDIEITGQLFGNSLTNSAMTSDD